MKTIEITEALKRIFGENIAVATESEVLAAIEGNTTGLKINDVIKSFEGSITVPQNGTIPKHIVLIYLDDKGIVKRMSPISFANSRGVDKKDPASIVNKKVILAEKKMIGTFLRNCYEFE
jgi:hypothetical protein